MAATTHVFNERREALRQSGVARWIDWSSALVQRISIMSPASRHRTHKRSQCLSQYALLPDWPSDVMYTRLERNRCLSLEDLIVFRSEVAVSAALQTIEREQYESLGYWMRGWNLKQLYDCTCIFFDNEIIGSGYFWGISCGSINLTMKLGWERSSDGRSRDPPSVAHEHLCEVFTTCKPAPGLCDIDWIDAGP